MSSWDSSWPEFAPGVTWAMGFILLCLAGIAGLWPENVRPSDSPAWSYIIAPFMYPILYAAPLCVVATATGLFIGGTKGARVVSITMVIALGALYWSDASSIRAFVVPAVALAIAPLLTKVLYQRKLLRTSGVSGFLLLVLNLLVWIGMIAIVGVVVHSGVLSPHAPRLNAVMVDFLHAGPFLGLVGGLLSLAYVVSLAVTLLSRRRS